MAMHGKVQLVRLRNKNTGTVYITKKNPKNTPDKLVARKYDKKTRKVETFTEEKMK